MSIYRPRRKLAVRLFSQRGTAGGRPPGRPPTVKNMGHPIDRPVDRRKTESRAFCPVDRPLCLANVHRSVHIDRPTDRPALDPGRLARSTARAWQPLFWVRKIGF